MSNIKPVVDYGEQLADFDRMALRLATVAIIAVTAVIAILGICATVKTAATAERTVRHVIVIETQTQGEAK